ncbi:MAG: type II secretion system F family protein [bacterium]|nr:type II secretion system F family protein [bacterium]
MAKFTYTAVGKNGKQHSGTVESASEAALTALLTRQGLRPLMVKKASTSKGFSLGIGKKVKLKDLVMFTRQLATMINAGVPLVRSLATLQGQTDNQEFKKHLVEISKEVESGTTFANALAKHPSVFSPIYVNMIAAGEAGGILDEILKKLALQQEKDARIRAKFKSAMMYPTVLIGITLMVFIGLMTVAVPKIGTIIQDLTNGGELPVMTKIMLSISNFLTKYWFIHISVVVIGSFLLGRYLRTPNGRRTRDKTLLKIPAVRSIIIKIAVARFSRIFASLMTAGVTVLDSIEITAKAIGNSVIEEELMSAAKEVANGKQFSEPLSRSKVFPPIVAQMLAIGEETGQTDTVLLKVADFYEEEVDAAVDGLSSILEPIMIVVMGAMVGLIAASVIGPISNLSNQI